MGRPRKNDTHLPPCVYFKHGAYWYVKTGQPWKRLPEDGPSTLASALEAYAQIVEAPRGDIDPLIDDALKSMEARQPPLSANTLKTYSRVAKRLKKMLQQFRPEQVKPVHAAGIKKALSSKPNMCNHFLSFARGVWDYALEEQWPGIEINPFTGIRRHKEKRRDRLLTDAEIQAIYSKAGDRLQIIIDLCVRTGQRITAVLRIRRSDLTSEGIRFPKHKTDGKGVVKWTPELREVVDRALALHGKLPRTTLLFNRRNKAPDYRSVKEQWDIACAAAGVEDAHLHDMRAVAGTKAEEQGLNPQALLMHASPQNTQRYLRSKKEPVVEGPSFRQSIRPAEKKS